MNGVPVIDVTALDQGGESSNESTGTGETQSEAHGGDVAATDPIGQTSPHFITVTGGFDLFVCWVGGSDFVSIFVFFLPLLTNVVIVVGDFFPRRCS